MYRRAGGKGINQLTIFNYLSVVVQTWSNVSWKERVTGFDGCANQKKKDLYWSEKPSGWSRYLAGMDRPFLIEPTKLFALPQFVGGTQEEIPRISRQVREWILSTPKYSWTAFLGARKMKDDAYNHCPIHSYGAKNWKMIEFLQIPTFFVCVISYRPNVESHLCCSFILR